MFIIITMNISLRSVLNFLIIIYYGLQSYTHRNKLSPQQSPNKNGNKNKLRHSFSQPTFSVHSTQPEHSYKDSVEYQYQHLLRDIIKADVPIFAKSFKLCPV